MRAARSNVFDRFRKTHTTRDVFRSRAEPLFLSAARHHRRQYGAVAHIQKSNSFGAVDFVSGKSQEINAELGNRARQIRECLDRISMKNGV